MEYREDYINAGVLDALRLLQSEQARIDDAQENLHVCENGLVLDLDMGICCVVWRYAKQFTPDFYRVVEATYPNWVANRLRAVFTEMGLDEDYPVQSPTNTVDSEEAFDEADYVAMWQKGEYAACRWELVQDLIDHMESNL